MSKTSKVSSPQGSRRNPLTDAYVGGLVDGEGCLYISKDLTPILDVGMSAAALPLLRRLHEERGGWLGVTRPESEKWAAAWSWTVQGEALRPILAAVTPHLQLKREQALMCEELLRIKDTLRTRGTGSRAWWTPETRSQAKMLRACIQTLNRKGPDSKAPMGMARMVLDAVLADGEWQPAQATLFDVQGSGPSLVTWQNSGMAWRGGLSTRSTSVCPSGADACSCSPSLADVLEQSALPRYSLSPRAAAGILRRAEARGRELPEALAAALSELSQDAAPAA